MASRRRATFAQPKNQKDGPHFQQVQRETRFITLWKKINDKILIQT
jgi:hypothetical protein